MTRRSELLDPVHETDQSSTQPVDVGHDLVSHRQVSELGRKVDLTIESAERAKGDSEEPNELFARAPTRPSPMAYGRWPPATKPTTDRRNPP